MFLIISTEIKRKAQNTDMIYFSATVSVTVLLLQCLWYCC